ncbi:MAG: cation diffusion facilitator family transporter [Bacteroidia bacterium]
MERDRKKIKILSVTLFISTALMLIKFAAWIITHSNAILTDALESIVNVFAGAFALYSVNYASKPKDEDHPYGHGKIEFLSVGLEGTLIAIAGVSIIIKSVYNLFYPHEIHSLNLGLYLTLFTGFINLFMGIYLQKKGKELHSVTLVADGKHIISDAYSSAGLIIGIALIWISGINWMDSAVAILFGVFILFTGYKLMRKSLAGVLDETDYLLVDEIIDVLNKNRKEEWIDIHNFRVIKYGSNLHIDCHITLPWYYSLEQSHQVVSEVETILTRESENHVEVFIHADPCLPDSCNICALKNCAQRKHDFVKQITWTKEVILKNQKHSL